MKELIEALTILLEYDNPQFPTHCEHDELHVAVSPKNVSEADMKRLAELSFTPDEFGGFSSYRFGSN